MDTDAIIKMGKATYEAMCCVEWKPSGAEQLLFEACNALQKLQAENERLKEENSWIPVSERLPESSRVVLVTCDDGNARWVKALFCNLGTWTPNNNDVKHITHWKPIILPDQALRTES